MTMTAKELGERIKSKGTMLCVGLDTDSERLPDSVRRGVSGPEAVYQFNKRIIDATAPYCVAYKPNLAFYEAMGSEGLSILGRTVEYLRLNCPSHFLIADAKRGDIGNTAKLYAKTLFETFGFDAATVNAYMGVEAVQPFLEYPGRFAIVVALSSNPSAADFQFALQDGMPLYEALMRKMMAISTPDQLMFVAGATKAGLFSRIRSFCPDNFLLVPGVGAQGGSAEEVIRSGANANGGLLINSSRAILYASSGEDFAEAAAAVASRTARWGG